MGIEFRRVLKRLEAAPTSRSNLNTGYPVVPPRCVFNGNLALEPRLCDATRGSRRQLGDRLPLPGTTHPNVSNSSEEGKKSIWRLFPLILSPVPNVFPLVTSCNTLKHAATGTGFFATASTSPPFGERARRGRYVPWTQSVRIRSTPAVQQQRTERTPTSPASLALALWIDLRTHLVGK